MLCFNRWKKLCEFTECESYKLSASPNCRYESGSCTLKNGELTVEIRAKRQETGGWLFTLNSNQQLNTAALVIAPEGDTVTAPINMTRLSPVVDSEFKSNWSLSIRDFDKENDLMRVALSLAESFYYVETQAIFPDFITQFDN